MSTKEKIKEAMYHLVATKGYNKASIGQICKEVNISKPSVYYYYNSKEEIFLDIIKEQLEVEYGDYDAFDSITDPQEYYKQLYQLGEEIFQSYWEDTEWRLFAAEIDIEASRSPAIRQCQKAYEEKLFAKLEKTLKRGLEIKALPEDFDIFQGARLIDAMIIGINGLASFEDNEQELKQIWQVFLERVIGVKL